jgi:enamine deaminase RidA (YjgF/YER057c/UK114 family)
MSQHRELVNPPELHPAPGFSHVAIASGRRVVHFAGQVALDQQFGIVGGDDLGEQTKAAMRNVELAMGAAGVGWDDIVRRTIYTLHPTEFATITASGTDDRRGHRAGGRRPADRDRVHGGSGPAVADVTLTDMTRPRDTACCGPDMSREGSGA